MAVLTYKCPNCGGEINFNPTTQQYDCPYCFSHFNEAEIQATSQEDQKVPIEDQGEGEVSSLETGEKEAVLYNCPSCGAQIVTDKTTAATFCYYCHNPVILSGKLSGEFLPNKIIPFKINKDEVVEIFQSWIKSKKFVPQNFFSKEQIEKISGIYFPYWVMDCDVKSTSRGSATKSKVWITGEMEYTEISHYEIVRKGTIHFEDLSKNALKKANKRLVEGVMPFKTLKMKPFNMSYLSGFQAEKRDMEQMDLQDAMNDEMKKYADVIIKESVSGYTSVNMNDTNLNVLQSSWEYALLPVWVLTYQARDKVYYFALNGQTKKICGELPVDYKKLVLFCGAITAVLFAILMMGGWFLW